MSEVVKSNHVYIIYANRNTSQFDQKQQIMRCKVLEAHRDYVLVESLKRYNRKYEGAQKVARGKYSGMPLRRVNKEQVVGIIDEQTGKRLNWETLRRREGAVSPGRARGGR